MIVRLICKERSVKINNCAPCSQGSTANIGREPALFEKGDEVLLEGLARAPHLNQRAATVKQFSLHIPLLELDDSLTRGAGGEAGRREVDRAA